MPQFPNLRRSAIAALLSLSLTTPASAVWWASEWTQVLNNIELVATALAQAKEVQQTFKQYETMMQNLQQLNDSDIRAKLQPFLQQKAQFQKLAQSVKDFKESSQNAREVLSRRMEEAKKLNLSPKQYFEAEYELAANKGGYYRQQLDADLSALDQATVRANKLNTLQASVPKISGNIEGMQTLAMYAHNQASELGEIRTLMLRSSVEAQNKRVDEEAAAKYEAKKRLALQRDAEEMRKRNEAAVGAIKFQLPKLNQVSP
ncbi:hypothetical protein [Parachitinimonas caeni]|uniref:P-type conjugative transfer protein TrbJ n=1 Tax=Parachitinimonas caeni TaxID=3031301 RepID=A0ABT7E2J2_9NEIS|nr:hypothetical protein [Parachitinimonas caeni]MDK2126264.1 hypothetical protein [Parachitinimonas caeni]